MLGNSLCRNGWIPLTCTYYIFLGSTRLKLFSPFPPLAALSTVCHLSDKEMTSGDVWKIGTSQLLIHVLCRRADVEKGHTMAKKRCFESLSICKKKKIFYSVFRLLIYQQPTIFFAIIEFSSFFCSNSTLNSINQASFNDVTLGVPFIPHILCHKSNKVSFHHHIASLIELGCHHPLEKPKPLRRTHTIYAHATFSDYTHNILIVYLIFISTSFLSGIFMLFIHELESEDAMCELILMKATQMESLILYRQQ